MNLYLFFCTKDYLRWLRYDRSHRNWYHLIPEVPRKSSKKKKKKKCTGFLACLGISTKDAEPPETSSQEEITGTDESLFVPRHLWKKSVNGATGAGGRSCCSRNNQGQVHCSRGSGNHSHDEEGEEGSVRMSLLTGAENKDQQPQRIYADQHVIPGGAV
eukprot:CAMPEP_0170191396 /NCGR_PEP_ID=MMETSP0040_2-20121228/51615_1 /TAXON_ID=641309 /ORGANISM="Lotharella oceanica, Strain CCMP622" /LENGTH=158 /DNA_ID=CAMNT_0010439469 /DNA_START=465 /DNA_END=941 /DNA_ORIENTATION=-